MGQVSTGRGFGGPSEAFVSELLFRGRASTMSSVSRGSYVVCFAVVVTSPHYVYIIILCYFTV